MSPQSLSTGQLHSRRSWKLPLMFLACGSLVCLSLGTDPSQPRQQALAQEDSGQGTQPDAEQGDTPASQLPSDPRLIAIHREFVLKAEKIALDYENDDKIDAAMAIYEQILKLVPEYAKAKDALARLREHQTTAEKQIIDIVANKDWQDSGVTLIKGKPVRIEATGKWSIKWEYEVSPDGIEIPKELKDFRLGSLTGLIVSESAEVGKPFMVGAKGEFLAAQSGRLLLRMHDGNHADNSGKISVSITGTFEVDD